MGHQKDISEIISLMRANKPHRAEALCREYLDLHPGSLEHLKLLADALTRQGRLPEAEQQLQHGLQLQPRAPFLHEGLGSVFALQGKFDEAIASLQEALRLDPTFSLARKKLSQALAEAGRGSEADTAFEQYLDGSPDKKSVAEGLEHLKAGRVEEAIVSLQEGLKQNPNNVDALRYLGAILWREKNQLGDAEALLRRACDIAPDYIAAHMALGSVLIEQKKYVQAIDVLKLAIELDNQNAEIWAHLGNAYAVAHYQEEARKAFEKSIAINPNVANAQMSYAHVLKTLGDQPASLQAYRAAIKIRPQFGEVYWSMANLKTFRFEPEEVAEMERQAIREDLTDSASVHFRFALGKAYEDEKNYEKAWENYHTGNMAQRMRVSHDPVEMEVIHNEILEVFTEAFIKDREGHGHDAQDPILIVGLPRSGSTLVEQILASHSQVEGTSELPDLSRIAATIGRYRADGVRYPKALRELQERDWKDYGREYMDATKRHRETEHPFFTDKLPNNFPQVGFLHLILPNAKVINARRHPFDSCLGGYKQLFGRGQNFTYDMFELAEYYRKYHEMMAHWHKVLPGKVLDIHYEETVMDLETQVRRILDHCGLPFEEQCLRFHETERAVRTASSEQVRQPLYSGALGMWRNYEQHLDLWREELGNIVSELPETVQNAGL